MRQIYLDNAATTKVDPEVVEAMLPYLTQMYGNPGSMHKKGIEAREAMKAAREDVATNLNCASEEIIFTGSMSQTMKKTADELLI